MVLGNSQNIVPKLFNKVQQEIYRAPFVPIGSMVSPIFAGLSSRAKDNTATTYLATTNTKCSSSQECGAGFYCNNGTCVSSGGGNTYSITSGIGCSVGPNGVDSGTYGGGGSRCGSSSGTGNGCYSAGCGQGSRVNDAASSGSKGNPCATCCREDSSGNVRCTSGSCPPEGTCSEYCTNEKESYGSYGEGCDSRNTCTECSSCNDGTCEEKSDAERPCHCNNECGEREDITCCNFRDTCKGRIEGLYCHPTYRTWYPRCYDPDVECLPGGSACRGCTTGSGPSVPDGCTSKGFITSDLTGETIYIYECCEVLNEKPGCVQCDEDQNCGECQYCDRGLCVKYSNCPGKYVPPPVYARAVGTVYGNGWYGPPEQYNFTGYWVNVSNGESIGAVRAPNLLPSYPNYCVEYSEGGPWVSTRVITHPGDFGCSIECNNCNMFVVYDANGNYLNPYSGKVGYQKYTNLNDPPEIVAWGNVKFEFSYNQQDVFYSNSGNADPNFPSNLPQA